MNVFRNPKQKNSKNMKTNTKFVHHQDYRRTKSSFSLNTANQTKCIILEYGSKMKRISSKQKFNWRWKSNRRNKLKNNPSLQHMTLKRKSQNKERIRKRQKVPSQKRCQTLSLFPFKSRNGIHQRLQHHNRRRRKETFKKRLQNLSMH
ncbi:hypothetical protein BLNAU_801 [Blattamonas nauphoetae]|uniref:Uncharacterized protein n=1 Tax=Blattamonas nauphoetae TaxID=2049346 RepID=A0ABQ9YKJ4_9EUKA|nr:hypothetical protein BLNAU_801 [Blattamonas nauphoetae]